MTSTDGDDLIHTMGGDRRHRSDLNEEGQHYLDNISEDYARTHSYSAR
ncbi:MAG: hypothetical protein H8E35_11650 [Ardenticatenia bacterium]|nr:hypothetical protein [Ardenticatenia bacterium]